MRIYTDHKWKQFKYRNEVPEKVLKSEFDWTSEDDVDGFILYKGNWYYLSEFERIPNGLFPKGWQGYHSDSFFSGILIQVSEDSETYRIGTYCS